MHEEELHALLERYQAGTCSPEEKETIDRWFDDAVREPLLLSRNKKKRLEEEMFRRIQGQTQEDRKKSGSIFLLSKRWMGVAAAFLLVVATWYLLSRSSSVLSTEASHLFSYQTQAGQRVMLVLPDSSFIWLNSNTAIRYDQAFPGHAREIFLDSGEAFFDVKKQLDKPFIVHVGQLDTRVLGTSFNIRTKDYRNRYHLSVNTGKVQVLDASSSNKILGTLHANQRLSYDYESKQASIRSVAPEEMSAWKENVFLLRNASWEQVKDQLETWYGISVTLNGRHSHADKFTAQLENPSLKEALDVLRKINYFTYQITGKEVTVHR